MSPMSVFHDVQYTHAHTCTPTHMCTHMYIHYGYALSYPLTKIDPSPVTAFFQVSYQRPKVAAAGFINEIPCC